MHTHTQLIALLDRHHLPHWDDEEDGTITISLAHHIELVLTPNAQGRYRDPISELSALILDAQNPEQANSPPQVW